MALSFVSRSRSNFTYLSVTTYYLRNQATKQSVFSSEFFTCSIVSYLLTFLRSDWETDERLLKGKINNWLGS